MASETVTEEPAIDHLYEALATEAATEKDYHVREALQ